MGYNFKHIGGNYTMYDEGILWDALLYSMEGEDPSKAIDNHLRREQRQVVKNHRLPIKTNGGIPDDNRFKGVIDSMTYEEREKIVNKNIAEYTKQQYEKMGIKVIKEYDDLFYSVELPDGWEIKATDHSMWNDVVDDKGRKRISFFYKGGYDVDAFSNFERRYSFKILPFDEYKSNVDYLERKFKPWKVFITDCGNKIKELKEITPSNDKEYLNIDDVLREEAILYLNDNYPDWQDINAYWD